MATGRVITTPDKHIGMAVWTGVNANENGDGADLGRFQNKTVQVTGTFDTETVVIQGSLDGTNWFQLNDKQDGALSFSAAGLAAIQEEVLHIRPSVSNGGGAPSINCIIVGFAP